MYVDPDPPRANFCFIKLPPKGERVRESEIEREIGKRIKLRIGIDRFYAFKRKHNRRIAMTSHIKHNMIVYLCLDCV